MKNLIVIVAFLVVTTSSYAQSFFDKLEDMDGIDMVVITKDAFEMLSKFENIKIDDNEGMKIFQMINDLNEFKMFSTDNKAIADKMEGMVSTAIKKQKLTQLMRVKDDDSRIKIYVKATKNKDYVSEVLMFIRGINKKTKENVDSVIVSLTGNIDVNKMSEMTDAIIKESNRK